ncbi:MAG: hypothetical protein AAFU85_22880 [Planctomycetota bacterium]
MTKKQLIPVLAFGIFFAANSCGESLASDLKPIERQLEELLTEVAKGSDRQAFLYPKMDQTFTSWINATAPAARHSVGWPDGDRGKQAFKRRLIEEKKIHSQIDELRRVLQTSRQTQSVSVQALCKRLAERGRGRVFGIPVSSKRSLEQSIAKIRTVPHLSGYFALMHLVVAQQQLAQTDGYSKLASETGGLVTELSRLLEKDMAATEPTALGQWLDSISRRYQIRTVNRDQELHRRSEMESLLLKHPALRRYLVSRQARKITQMRWQVARETRASTETATSLKATEQLAERVERAYLKRCGSYYDRELQRLIQSAETTQDEVRHLQESGDESSFAVATYSLDRRQVTASHLRDAAQCAKAMGAGDFAESLETLVNRLEQ